MPAHVVRGILAAVVLTLIVGCGGSSSSSQTTAQPSTFRTDFKLAITQFKETSHSVGLALQKAPSQSDTQIVPVFSALAAQWQADLNRLKSLTPPPAVAGEFTKLTDAATRTEGVLRAIVSAARTHNASTARQDGANLVRYILAAEKASKAITAKLGIS